MKGLHIIITALICAISTISHGQSDMGSWRIFSPNLHTIGIEHQDKVVYAAFELGILVFDKEFNEQNVWTYANHLSDFRITAIGKHEASKSIIIGYDNGNLDIIQNERIFNIPGIKLASISGKKQINSFQMNGNFIYVNTGFGIVVVDPKKKEIKDTYYPSTSEEILSSAFLNDTLWALTPKRMLKCRANNPAISNAAYWTQETVVPEITIDEWSYKHLLTWKDELVLTKVTTQYANDTIFRLHNGQFNVWIDNGGYAQLGAIKVKNGQFFTMGENYIYKYSDWSVQDFWLNQYPFAAMDVVSMDWMDNDIWIGDRKLGLIQRLEDGSLIRHSFQGPPRSEAFAMDWHKGKMVIAPGNNGEISPTYTEVGAMIFEKEQWRYASPQDPMWSGKYIWDNGTIAINPVNDKEFAIGTLSQIPLSIVNMDGQVLDTFSKYNSPLTTYTQNNLNWHFLDDLTYDSKGNLWMINGFSPDALKLRSKDGEWSKFNLGYGSSNKKGHKIYVDYFDNIWVAMKNNGLIGYSPGADKIGASDDKKVHLNSSALLGDMWPSSNITAITMDYDNELWIGTDQGFCILYNSETIFDKAPGTYKVQRPKTASQQVQEGEFNEHQYVLGSTSITDIEIDGGNRKWIGTTSGGAILLSADGQQVLKQFTKDNSPLLSNNILDIEIDHYTGEVFFATDRGLITYRSDASHEDPEYSDVKIFPNPVLPDFNGLITIQGIRYNSDIKITDIAGNVVNKTNSNGGTATWNGLDFDGNKVAPGVYLIWTAANEGKGKFVGKVAVIN